MDENKIWERLPNETSKAYKGFQVYLSLPLFGKLGETRSLENVAPRLGLISTNSPDRWSAKYNWVERAKAYDAYTGGKALTLVEDSMLTRESELEEYRQDVATKLSEQLFVLNQVIDKALARMNKASASELTMDMSDIKKLVDSIEKKDNLARRLGGMPTNFTTESGEELDETTTYIIGSSE